MAIKEFQGRFRFLSNFWPAKVRVGKIVFDTVEHAFVASKTLDEREREKVRQCQTPGQAKRFGRRLKLRSDWEQVKDGRKVKVHVMKDLVRQKFFNNEELGDLLLATGDEELIEGNTWNDTFWGVCRGKGENWLGTILMEVRAELREARSKVS